MNSLRLCGLRRIDPATGHEQRTDLQIGSASESSTDADTEEVDAQHLIALPGFTDLFARLCEPGFSRRGSIASESRAALRAGFTTVLCTPDTDPPIDSTTTVRWILERAREAPAARVRPMAALTAALAGEQLAELASLKHAGCVAATQADRPVASRRVLLQAMEYAATFDMPLILTPMDAELAAGGCAHGGAMASRMGLPAIPVAAETVAISELLELVRSVGCHLHLARISSARGLELVDSARQRDLPISASVGIHHLFFTDEQLAGFDARFHSAVPFRSRADRDALRKAVRDGLIDVICSDHCPLDHESRLAPFPATEPGLSAYDVFAALLFSLPELLGMPVPELIRRVTTGPDRVLGGGSHTGAPAGSAPVSTDLVVIDPAGFRPVEETSMLSLGRNTPLLGIDNLESCTGEAVPLCATVRYVQIDGRIVYRADKG